MNSLLSIATSSQAKISSSELSVSDKVMEVCVSNYVPETSQEPDRFELGDYSGKEMPKTDLVLVNGELFEVAKSQAQQEGFNSNSGLFQTT